MVIDLGALDAEVKARRLAALVEASQDAIVAADLDGTLTDWNPGAERLYGYSAQEALGKPVATLRIESERDQVEQRLAAIMAGERIPPYDARHRRKDGSTVDVSISVAAVEDASGAVVGTVAIIRDLTARLESDRSLQEARQRFQTAFEQAPSGMALVHPDGRWLAANPALCRLLGQDVFDLLTTDIESIAHPDDSESDLRWAERALAGELDSYELEKRCLRPDGSVVWVILDVALVRDELGEPLYFIHQLQDITERKAAEEELRSYSDRLNELALKDPLTGLRNYRDLHAMLDLEVERSRRYDTEWGVVLVDVDGLSEINRCSGHMAGDRVLRQVATAIAEVSRSSDLVARIGGDEFALVLPHTAGEHAERAAERIAAEVAEKTEGASVSIGTASWPADGQSKELVLLRADMQLHAVKPLAQARRSALGSDPLGDRGLRRVLSLAREQLGMDVAYLTELTDEHQLVRVVSGEAAASGIEEGAKLALAATFCQRMLDGRIGNAVPDAAREPEAWSLPMVAEAGVGSYVGVPVEVSDGSIFGTLCCVSLRVDPTLGDRHVELMRFLAKIARDEIERDGWELHERRVQAELTGVRALVAALIARDQYTGEHSQTVVRLATAVARRLRLAEEHVAEVEQVALLHDVGKVGIPDSILQKRGTLTDQEWELMRQHPAIGARILAGTETLSHLAAAVKAEHERYDGEGYPDGLRGDAIPLASRITFACDAFHAMTSDRPYRAALDPEVAVAELRAGAGRQFDPDVVAAVLASIEAEAAGEPAPLPASTEGAAALPGGVLNALLPRQTPLWEPRPPSGSLTLGEVRAVCQRCGTHVTATVRRATLSGTCGNCGGYELDLLEGEPA